MNRIRTLIHLHTDYSFDSNISLESLIDHARRENIGCVAVTDHDTIEGARRLAGMVAGRGSLKVIVGEEVTTSQGHLIGLFLRERVEPGMSARETATAIRKQGGLVLLPHPFVNMFGCGLGSVSDEIAHLIHAVEVNNAQNLFDGPDRKADLFARRHALPAFVGADSHRRSSIGPCLQIMNDFHSPATFLASLNGATLQPGRHPLSYFAAMGLQVAQHMLGLSLPEGFGANARTLPIEAPPAAAAAA